MMSNFQDVLDNQQRIEGSLFSKLAEFDEKLQQAATSDSKPNLDKLTQEYSDFKKLVSSMFSLLHTQINLLASQVDNLDNQQRLNALLFNGIQETDSEDCKATIIDIINNKLNLRECLPSAIFTCHRLGVKSPNKHRPIIVRFNEMHTRNKVWSEKKSLKSSAIVINEFLTKTRQTLFISARKHFGMNHCWTRDGHIYVKISETERKRVISAVDLEHLIKKYPVALPGGAPTGPSRLAKPKGTRELQLLASSEPLGPRRNTAAKGKANK